MSFVGAASHGPRRDASHDSLVLAFSMGQKYDFEKISNIIKKFQYLKNETPDLIFTTSGNICKVRSAFSSFFTVKQNLVH